MALNMKDLLNFEGSSYLLKNLNPFSRTPYEMKVLMNILIFYLSILLVSLPT